MCTHDDIYLIEETLLGETYNHKQCDTVGFWEDGTGTFETRFRLLNFNIFSLRRTFPSIVSQLVLSCVVKTGTLYYNRSTFLCVPEIQWVASFIAVMLFNRQRFFN